MKNTYLLLFIISFSTYCFGQTTPTWQQTLNSGPNAVVTKNVSLNTTGTFSLSSTGLSTISSPSLTISSGTLKLSGAGTPGSGKVLTSDASGLATWGTPSSAYWGLTGNTGTVDGTNWLGTNNGDDVPFTIRVNGIPSGRIETNNNDENTFWGYAAGNAKTPVSSVQNTGVGMQSLLGLSTGTQNSTFGYRAGATISTKSGTTALGCYSFGDYNVGGGLGIGYFAGKYEDEDGQFYLDAINRTNKANGRALSMFYGTFGSAVSTQSLTINAQVKINDGSGSTGDVFTKKSNGYGNWEAPYSNWTTTGNDIYNNNSGGIGIGSGIAYPLSTQMLINAISGRTGAEIYTTNTLGLKISGAVGGADIYNLSAASFGAKVYSEGDGLIVQSKGTGSQFSSPGLVLLARNNGTLSATSTDIGFSFEDARLLNGNTATGTSFQIKRSNAATGNLFDIINNGSTLIAATYDGKIIQNGMKCLKYTATVVDDGTYDLPTGITILKCSIQTAHSTTVDGVMSFRATSDAVVVEMNVADALNSSTTDTDTKLCAFDNGSNVRVKNRSGGSVTLMLVVDYF